MIIHCLKTTDVPVTWAIFQSQNHLSDTARATLEQKTRLTGSVLNIQHVRLVWIKSTRRVTRIRPDIDSNLDIEMTKKLFDALDSKLIPINARKIFASVTNDLHWRLHDERPKSMKTMLISTRLNVK